MIHGAGGGEREGGRLRLSAGDEKGKTRLRAYALVGSGVSVLVVARRGRMRERVYFPSFAVRLRRMGHPNGFGWVGRWERGWVGRVFILKGDYDNFCRYISVA